MAQIGIALIAVSCIVMGIKAMMKGEINLSKDKVLKENTARLAGGIVILVGVALAAFALIGIPYLMRA